MGIDEEGPPTKKLKVKNLKKKVIGIKESIPTREEVTQLKETQSLFHSNLFRFQIDALLKEIQVKNETKEKVLQWFEKFKLHVNSDRDFQKNVDLSDEECDLLKPVLDRSANEIKKENVCYHPPEEIKLIGSFPLDLAINSTLSVDIMIRMPKKCFYNSDNLNLRYFYKRAAYIFHFGNLLGKTDLIESVEFEYHQSNLLKPILVIKPRGSFSHDVIFKIHPCPPADFFKLSKLTPNRNNIRSKWFLGENVEDEEFATPRYNSSLLSDILMESCFDYLQNVLPSRVDSGGILDGVLLLKVWLHQRQLDKGFGCVSNFLLTAFVAHLLQLKKIRSVMSSYQVICATWLELSRSDWMHSDTTQLNQPEFLNHFPVAFTDSTGSFNLCSHVTENTYLRLKHEADLASKLATSAENFDSLFMQKIPFVRKFDHILKIKPTINYNYIIEKFSLSANAIDYLGDNRVVLPTLSRILSKALGPRVDLIDIELSTLKSWSLTESPLFEDLGITLGLLLNQEHYCSILDKGPSADAVEAKDFRDFWGSKSDLRRFQDTTVCEAVTWPCESISDRRFVASLAAKYILKTHLNIDSTSIKYVGNQLNCLVSYQFARDPNNFKLTATGEELMANAITVLDKLRKDIENLQDQPLTITSVQGISPTFRYTEVFPPIPRNSGRHDEPKKFNCLIPNQDSYELPHYFQPLDVMITLEASNKWPNDLEAVQRIKAAFYIKITKKLREQYRLNGTANPDHFAVFKDGYVFRFRIAYKRESSLLKMERTSDGLLKLTENDQSLTLEKEIIHLPTLTSALHGLQLQHGAFSTACRLAKRWVSAQLLADHVSDIAIELTVAHVFISASSYTTPKSPQVAFQRWLRLIAHHNWKMLPLIVNFNNELSAIDLAEIDESFHKNRNVLPPLFISTPYDKFTSCWSKNAPLLPVLNQLIKLADAALQIMEKNLESQETSKLIPLFRPSLKPYHILIHLDPRQLSLKHCAVGKGKIVNYREYSQRNNEMFPTAGFNLVECYLNELKTTFGDIAVFFYDKYGGNTITVLLKNKEFQAISFKVSHVNFTKPRVMENEDDATLTLDIESIVEDFKIIGNGLVKSVTVNI